MAWYHYISPYIWLWRKLNPDPIEPTAPNVGQPTSNEALPVTHYFGTNFVANMNCIWWGDLTTTERGGGGGKSGGSPQGYSIFLGMIWSLGAVTDRLLGFYLRKSETWDAPVDGIPGSTQINVKTEEARLNQSGGYDISALTYYDGRQTSIGAYFAAQTGVDLAYKGTSLLTLEKSFVGDDTIQAPPWQALVGRWDFSDSCPWDTTSTDVIGFHCNAAQAICHILVGTLGWEQSLIDIASFQTADALFFSEGIGISFRVDKQQPAKEYIKQIENHMNCQVYPDPDSGRVKIAVIRDDYTPAALTILKEGEDYWNLKLKRESFDNRPTEVQIKHTTEDFLATEIHTFQNPALRFATGRKQTTSLEYLMFNTAAQIAWLQQRVALQEFYVLAELTFEVTPALVPFMFPGAVFKIENVDWNIADLVIRITEVEGEGEKKMGVRVRATEDIYGIGEVSQMTVPVGEHTPADYELSTPNARVYVGDALPSVTIDPAFQIFAAPPSTGIATYNSLLVNGVKDSEFVASGLGDLEAAYAPTDIIDEGSGFIVDSALNMTACALTNGGWQRLNRVAVFEDTNEVVAIRNVTDLGGDRFQITGIIRNIDGVLGGHASHPLGTKVWFPPNDAQLFPFFDYSLRGEIKVVPGNPFSVGPETIASYTYAFGPETALDVSNQSGSRAGVNVTLNWIPRNRMGGARLASADIIEAEDDVPESYVQIFDGATNVVDGTGSTVAFTDDGVPKTYTIKAAVGGGRVATGVDIFV